VIVVDQSSIHISDAILDKLEEWQERQITIFVLPSYSPQLNLLEILWRFIKYEWLGIDAYSSWETFVESVEKILKEFGENYVINSIAFKPTDAINVHGAFPKNRSVEQ